ncbi:MAG: hypothetical protein ACPL28_11810 [bacterium]
MSIFDELKSIGKIFQEAGKIDLYEKILSIQQQLMEMNNRITSLENENRDLKEKFKIKETLFYENNAYWQNKEDGTKDGPFCTRCWDKNKDLIRLDVSDANCGICPECKWAYRFSKDDDAMGVIVNSW